MVRIVGDRDICTGAGMCALTAPELFEQDDEVGLVVVIREHVEGEALEAARKAVSLCPSGALSLEDDSAGD
jgi:ferredoxin